MANSVDIMRIVFSEKITESQVPLFRGAIMSCFPESETLMHNHVDDNFRYAYPLVQYKRINGQAAIVALGDGSRLLSSLDHSAPLRLRIGLEEPRDFSVAEICQETADFATGDDLLSYKMQSWLPLNQRNYGEYSSLAGIVERTMMLERILIGNILSAAKGLGIRINEQLMCKIAKLREPRVSTVKDVKLMSFGVEFCANILLPDYIGLGKCASKGHGTIIGVQGSHKIF